jgi:hypothetical protein
MAADQKWSTWIVKNELSKYVFIIKNILIKISPACKNKSIMTRLQFEDFVINERLGQRECLYFFYKHAFKKLNSRNMMEWRILSETDAKEAEKYIIQYSPSASMIKRENELPHIDGYMLFFDWLCKNDILECYIPFNNIISRMIMPRPFEKTERMEYGHFMMKMKNMHYKERMPFYIFLYNKLIKKTTTKSSYWYIDTSTDPETLKSLFYNAFFNNIMYVDSHIETLPETINYTNIEIEYESTPLQLVYDDPHPVIIEKMDHPISDTAYLDGEFA